MTFLPIRLRLGKGSDWPQLMSWNPTSFSISICSYYRLRYSDMCMCTLALLAGCKPIQWVSVHNHITNVHPQSRTSFSRKFCIPNVIMFECGAYGNVLWAGVRMWCAVFICYYILCIERISWSFHFCRCLCQLSTSEYKTRNVQRCIDFFS